MTSSHSRQGRRRFVLHFVEMVLVMAVGMGVFSAVASAVFRLAGSSLMDQAGWLRISLMGVNMTIPMVLWMLLRRHTLAQNVEMAGAMLVPSFLSAGLVAVGILATPTGFVIQHAVMLPAMLGVMLWRYDEYAHHNHITTSPDGAPTAAATG